VTEPETLPYGAASSGHHLGEGAEMDGLVPPTGRQICAEAAVDRATRTATHPNPRLSKRIARPIHSITNGEADACDQTIRAVVQPYPSAGVNFEVI